MRSLRHFAVVISVQHVSGRPRLEWSQSEFRDRGLVGDRGAVSSHRPGPVCSGPDHSA